VLERVLCNDAPVEKNKENNLTAKRQVSIGITKNGKKIIQQKCIKRKIQEFDLFISVTTFNRCAPYLKGSFDRSGIKQVWLVKGLKTLS